MSEDKPKMRKVGAFWDPKPNAKSKGSGSVTVNGLRQRFVMLQNDRKKNPKEPDYILMSSDEPEVDPYYSTEPHDKKPQTAKARAADFPEVSDDDVPF
jgi:hypothetical protein